MLQVTGSAPVVENRWQTRDPFNASPHHAVTFTRAPSTDS